MLHWVRQRQETTIFSTAPNQWQEDQMQTTNRILVTYPMYREDSSTDGLRLNFTQQRKYFSHKQQDVSATETISSPQNQIRREHENTTVILTKLALASGYFQSGVNG